MVLVKKKSKTGTALRWNQALNKVRRFINNPDTLLLYVSIFFHAHQVAHKRCFALAGDAAHLMPTRFLWVQANVRRLRDGVENLQRKNFDAFSKSGKQVPPIRRAYEMNESSGQKS